MLYSFCCPRRPGFRDKPAICNFHSLSHFNRHCFPDLVMSTSTIIQSPDQTNRSSASYRLEIEPTGVAGKQPTQQQQLQTTRSFNWFLVNHQKRKPRKNACSIVYICILDHHAMLMKKFAINGPTIICMPYNLHLVMLINLNQSYK